MPVGTDYDIDNDGLIEISNLVQLDAPSAMIWMGTACANTDGCAADFPNAAAGMVAPAASVGVTNCSKT